MGGGRSRGGGVDWRLEEVTNLEGFEKIWGDLDLEEEEERDEI